MFQVLWWTLFGFVLGAIPFSILMGRLLAGGDIRQYGDHNPGAANAWRAAGWQAGVPALALDYLKGALPVGYAHLMAGMTGAALVPIALAPVLGHAFSPFLRLRGGKALAVTFGIWTGLLFADGPIVLGLLFGVFYFSLDVEAWAVLLGMVTFLFYLLSRQQELPILATWAGNTLILIWKHRDGLRHTARPNPILLNLLRRKR